jgi:hypothetical protein
MNVIDFISEVSVKFAISSYSFREPDYLSGSLECCYNRPFHPEVLKWQEMKY